MLGNQLFPRAANVDNADEETKLKEDSNHIARMVALLGPPPAQLLEKAGARALDFFDADGSLKVKIPDISLESLLEERLKRADQPLKRDLFLRFLRRCLTWTAETRATANELLSDIKSWLP